MNAKLKRLINQRKRRLQKRIDKQTIPPTPAIDTPSIDYELAERQQAIGCGGLGAIMQMIKQLDVRHAINRAIPILKMHMPYDEADHVLNIALNLLTGGTCLDHLEIRRTDEAYLNAVGAVRIPDPTTAGDFCRRLKEFHIYHLQNGLNSIRQKVWAQQSSEFFECAIIEADGTMVETSGACKEGIGMNHKKQWGYHPLVITLGNTNEILYIVNRSGNRPSHELASGAFDQAIEQCREAKFKKILLRGDTDFSLTENFDRWDDDGVHFIFGYDAKPNLEDIADSLPESAWKRLRRRSSPTPQSARRSRPENHKEAFVIDHEYESLHQKSEEIAEFSYRPGKCNRDYRMVVLRKQIEVRKGEQRLFDKHRYFFYITNESQTECSTAQVVFHANDRCNQENTISQLHNSGVLAAPLDNLVSNWAYMVIASLAWSLKCWSALLIRPQGNEQTKAKQTVVREKILRMEFQTYLQTVIQIPAQIIRTSRRLIYRLLSYRDSIEALLLIHDNVRQRLLC